jgi:hypothetical protein
VAQSVEDGEQDEPGAANQGAENGEPGEDALAAAHVLYEPAIVAEEALGKQAEHEADTGDAAADDEERLELRGADVRDVRDVCARRQRIRAGGGWENARCPGDMDA